MTSGRLIDLYIYHTDAPSPRFLLLLRAAGKIYEGQWRMIGGKSEEDEPRWRTALREMREETGLVPVEAWTVPAINQFYDHRRDVIHSIPAFAARVPSDAAIVLDDEHTDFRWVDAGEADILLPWPEQRRIVHLIHDTLVNRSIPEQWRLPVGS